MAMVAAQVSSVGGAIGVETRPKQGTDIHLYWPLHRLDTALPTPETGRAQGTLAGVAIVVVDDDPNVGEVIAQFLEGQGAEVTHCLDPRDALDVIIEAPDALGALITDYDMPHMNGGELTEKARAAAPGLPIFVVTALARRLNDPRVTDGQVKDILAKPVDLERLSARVAQAKGS